ncbi:hypothetical protein LJC71_02370 [Desulfosarcina sp. OttesenSCG-928-A07]|nr:hypothetical protein [Desulfosarcina sp. OttesenSCG-928-G17]MDL2328582.1 hypothetical protein [Desulfosarcina sp. OttesenSCG-928-A07]
MLPDNVTLEDILPHREGMRLVETVVELSTERAVTRSVVSSKWPMAGAQGVDALMLVELAAQTAGVNNGWKNRLKHGPAAYHVGWIVGIKSARILIGRLQIGTTVVVESRNRFEYDQLMEVHAIARIDEKTVAEVVLQLMEADAP